MIVPFRDWFTLAVLLSMTFLVYTNKLQASDYMIILAAMIGFFLTGKYVSQADRS